MSAFGVDVELGRDLGFLELHEIDDCVFDVDGVVFGLHDEGWRSVGRWDDVSVGREVFVGEGEVPGVDDDGEIGTAAQLIGGVDGVV